MSDANTIVDFPFDEEWYLRRYPGIADAVREGRCKSGLDHYIKHGRAEGRIPVPPFPKELFDRHNGPGFLSPTDFRVTDAALHRVAVVGSCNLESWHLEKYAPCPVDTVLMNYVSGLPEAGVATSAYDFAVVQLPLNAVIHEISLARLPYEKRAYEVAFAEACARLELMVKSWTGWNQASGLLTFVANFFVPQMNPAGLLFPRYDVRNPEHFVYRLNEHLESLLLQRPNQYLLDIDRIAASLGRRFWQDDSVMMTSHNALLSTGSEMKNRIEYVPPICEHYEVNPVRERVPFGAAVWAQLMTMYRIVRRLDAVKMVVVDLDDTLWNGVTGDLDDVDNSMILGWPLGFAESLLYLKQRGILVAIISKNEESRIREVWPRIFGHRLRLSDFAAVKINWAPKVDNMRELLAGVNVLPRNVVFVDDNPAERAAMKASFPEMGMMGAHPYYMRRALLWSAETQVAALTEESAARTQMVQAQLERESTQQSMDHSEFLALAAPSVDCFWIRGRSHPRFARAFELLNKTNQFNTTGKRWTSAEIDGFFDSDGALFAFEVRDAFTAYGLVGVVLVSGRTLEQWVMSCRVLSYNIEAAVMAELVRQLRAASDVPVRAKLVHTDDNFPCRGLFAAHGFIERADAWELPPQATVTAPAHVSLKPKPEKERHPASVVHRFAAGAIAHLDFGAKGNAADRCLSGWSKQEPKRRWMSGTATTISVPELPAEGGCIFLKLLSPGNRTRLEVRLDGGVLDRCVVSHPWADPVWYGFPCPPRRDTADGSHVLELVHHDDGPLQAGDDASEHAADAPGLCASEMLVLPWRPFAAEARVTAPAVAPPSGAQERKALAMRFQSLGENCELGMVQRRCGAEPEDPFRFASIHLPRLVEGLECAFADLDEGGLEFIRAKGREWHGHHSKYGLAYHTFVQAEALPGGFEEKERRRLAYLGRQLNEQLTSAGKIFVIQRGGMSLAQVLPVWRLLRMYSEDNRLLWVLPAESPAQVGRVELLDARFALGFIDRLAPTDHVPSLSFDVWLQICATAAEALR